MRRSRGGFVLLEALVALLIIGVVFLALEGSLSIVLRSLGDSGRQTIAERLAETRRERALSIGCAAAAGVDSGNGIRVSWSTAVAGGLIHIDQASTYLRSGGERVDAYAAAGSCQ